MIVIEAGHYVFTFDADKLSNAYGVYALRASPLGTLEGLVANPDDGEWTDLTDLPLVTVTTKTKVKTN
jgi:hypothetical protein